MTELEEAIDYWIRNLIREVVEEAKENKRDSCSDCERAEHCGL